jgi:opacity protein-like surface antigen
MRPVRTALVTLTLLAAASSARAQVVGLPVTNSGIFTGLGIRGEAGVANSDYPKGTTFGITGILGTGPFGVTATYANYNPDAAGDNISTYGGTANLRVFGGGLSPLSVTFQAGYGHAKVLGQGYDHFPVGVGFAFKIPTPVLSLKPWVAPRADVQHGSETKTKFGASAGVEFSLLSGFGGQVSYDWVDQGNGLKPGIWGVALQWVFKVPGL